MVPTVSVDNFHLGKPYGNQEYFVPSISGLIRQVVLCASCNGTRVVYVANIWVQNANIWFPMRRFVFSSGMPHTGNEPDEDSRLATASVLQQSQEKGNGNEAKI
jgi:hypothetical protein